MAHSLGLRESDPRLSSRRVIISQKVGEFSIWRGDSHRTRNPLQEKSKSRDGPAEEQHPNDILNPILESLVALLAAGPGESSSTTWWPWGITTADMEMRNPWKLNTLVSQAHPRKPVLKIIRP